MRFIGLMLIAFSVSAFSQSNFKEAQAAQNEGRYEDAARLYKQYLKADPNNFTANYNLGVVLIILKKPQDALNYLTKAGTIDTSRPEPYIARANAHMDMGNPALALSALEKGESVAGNIPEYWLLRGAIEGALGNHQKTIDAFHKCMELAGQRADLAYEAGRILALLELKTYAESYYRKATILEPQNANYAASWILSLLNANHDQEAEKVAELAIKQFPTDSKIALAQIEVLYRTKGPETALVAANQAFDRNIRSPDLLEKRVELLSQLSDPEALFQAAEDLLHATPNHSKALVVRARRNIQEGLLDEAIKDSEKALESNRGNSDAHETRVIALSISGKQKSAEIAAGEWITALPKDAKAYIMLSDMLSKREANAEAGAIMERYITVFPNDVSGYERLATFYASAGLTNRLSEILNKAIQSGVKSPEMMIRLAIAYRQMGENSKAFGVLKEMQTSYPNDTRSWILSAGMHEQAFKWDAAVTVYEELLSTQPNHIPALEGLAKALTQLKKYEEAAARWERIYELNPDAQPVLLSAARCYILANKQERAVDLWNKWTSARPDDQVLRMMQAQYYIEQNQKSDALKVYKNITQAEPSHEGAWLAASRLISDDGDFASAADWLFSGLEYNYDSGLYLVETAKHANRANKLKEYDQLLWKLVKNDKISESLIIEFVDSANRNNALNEAKELLATKTNGKHAKEAWIGISRAKAKLGDPIGALDAIETAAKIDPKDSNLIRTYAGAAEASGNSKRAATAYGMLADIFPNDAAIRLKQIGYLIESGDKEMAKTLLMDAKKRFPANEEIKRLLESLRNLTS
jgi:tetratricopeptide (TPR) repeat protein